MFSVTASAKEQLKHLLAQSELVRPVPSIVFASPGASGEGGRFVVTFQSLDAVVRVMPLSEMRSKGILVDIDGVQFVIDAPNSFLLDDLTLDLVGNELRFVA
jgi:Fe-S cluster assembly iron-binding protein IscA